METNKRLFFNQRDDQKRAKMFNELLADPETTPAQKKKMQLWVFLLMLELNVEEAEAKALLASIITYESLHADEKDFCLRRAEVIQAEEKWKKVKDDLPYEWRKKELIQ